jgi:hypothetical protein
MPIGNPLVECRTRTTWRTALAVKPPSVFEYFIEDEQNRD